MNSTNDYPSHPDRDGPDNTDSDLLLLEEDSELADMTQLGGIELRYVPLDLAKVPPQILQHLQQPTPRRMLMAKNLLPLPPLDLVTVLYALMNDIDADVAEAAEESFDELPPNLLRHVAKTKVPLADPRLHRPEFLRRKRPGTAFGVASGQSLSSRGHLEGHPSGLPRRHLGNGGRQPQPAHQRPGDPACFCRKTPTSILR